MAEQTTSKTLHENLEEIINSSEVGTKLLSEPKLAKQLGVSRATLRILCVPSKPVDFYAASRVWEPLSHALAK